MNIGKVIDDYVNCSLLKNCEECEADTKIGDYGYNCCKLLTHYRQRLQDKIIEVIEKN